MSNFFELIDKHNRGYISRDDFKDMFQNMGDLRLNEHELNSFIDNFWRDKTAGVDYKDFLRIFSKYEIMVQDENTYGAGGRTQKNAQRSSVSDDTIRHKKRIFDEIKGALDESEKTIHDLFRAVDQDESHEIESPELFNAFKMMKINIR